MGFGKASSKQQENTKNAWENISYHPFDLRPELEDSVPTTEAQREIWTAIQFGTKANLAYNESISIFLRGELNLSALQSSLQKIVDRHQALRGFFSPDGRIFCIAQNLSVALPIIDLSTKLSASPDAKPAFQEWLEKEMTQEFVIETGPLFRCHLVKVSDKEHILVTTAHHLVCDGWSLALLLEELASFYNQAVAPSANKSEPDPADQFSEYARQQWEETQSEQPQLEFWKKQFETIPEAIDLPLKASRPKIRSFSAKRYDYIFPSHWLMEVKNFCAKRQLSLASFLMACYAICLNRLSNQSSLVIAVPASGQAWSKLFRLMGHCVNLLAIPWHLNHEDRVESFLAQAKEKLIAAFEQQSITFGRLLQSLPLLRSENRLPLVQVMFNYEQKLKPDLIRMHNLEVEYQVNPRCSENFELSLNLVDDGSRLKAQCHYNLDLFDELLPQNLCQSIQEVASQLILDSGKKLKELALARDQKIEDWNQSYRRLPDVCHLSELFDASLKMFQGNLAVSDGRHSLSYRQLRIRSERLAAILLSHGLLPNQTVGVLLERSIHLPVALLAILKAGGCFVPMDPRFPAKRLVMMAEDAQIKWLLCDQQQQSLEHFSRQRCIILDDIDWSAAFDEDELPKHFPSRQLLDPAYMIYTSGSTGRPKGVVIPHRAVINFLQSMAYKPGLQESDRLLAVTTISFDISILELFLPLLQGAYIRIASQEETLDGRQLVNIMQEDKINVLQATPATWRLILQQDFKPARSFKALCGGEPLSADLARDLCQRGFQVWNLYGPTETTVWSSIKQIDDPSRITIGKPIDNTQVEIIDQAGQRLPRGVWGEIVIGGHAVSLGYHQREDLNKEKFFQPVWSSQVYFKTGDIGRILADGELEIRGRIDHQVKVRGFRIELEDINHHFRQFQGIDDVLSLVREDVPGDQRIVSYYIGDATIDQQDIVDHLKELLPYYMIPQHIMRIDAFPRLANGKLDRQSLPAPMPSKDDSEQDTELNDPKLLAILKDPRGQVLKECWEKHLRLPLSRARDDFFLKGGHSLIAIQMLAELAARLGRNLSIPDFLHASNFQSLYQQLKSSDSSLLADIPKRAEEDRRLSIWQRRMWYVEQIDSETRVHNLPAAWRIRGKLDHKKFQQAFLQILENHDALRMSFDDSDGEARQVINLPQGNECQVYLDQEEEHILQLIQNKAAEKIKIDSYPLFQSMLFRISDEDWLYFFNIHHMIWDGWCFDILLEKLNLYYQALINKQPRPLPPKVAYADFSSWQQDQLNEEALQNSRSYWLEQFKNIPEPLDIPTDYPRPPLFQADSQTLTFELTEEEFASLQQFTRKKTMTPFMLLMAAYSLMLHTFSQQDDLVIGNPDRGRLRQDLEDVFGAFINVLPLRFQFHHKKVRKFLKHVKEVCLEAQQHADMPFDEILAGLNLPRDPSRTPLFSAMFSFQDVSRRVNSLAGLSLEQIFVPSKSVHTDLMLWVKKDEQGLSGGLDYRTDLWHPKTVESMLSCFRHILLQLARAEVEEIDKFSWLAAPDYQAIKRVSMSAPLKDSLPIPLTVLISQHAVNRPRSIAIEFRDEKLNYAELENRVVELTLQLAELGIQPGEAVGICSERNLDLIPAMLAVLRVGGTYVPLDPSLPKDRLLAMLQDADVKALITQLHHSLIFSQEQIKTLILDKHQPAINEPSASPASRNIQPEQAAYIIFTSGSTGRPKGVEVSHAALTHFLAAMQEQFPIHPKDRVLALTTISFDISIFEIFLPLLQGATVCFLDAEQGSKPELLAQQIEQKNITVMQATPASWQILQLQNWQGKQDLRCLIGGEAFSQELADFLIQRTAEVWNVYGPTEATVWACAQRLYQGEPVLIGRPLAGYQAWILNENLQALPAGAKGHLYLGGQALATAYYKQPELSRERFREHPKLGRLYFTGDLARIHGSQSIEFLGRSDFQVKLRGFRLELGEIENQIVLHPKVHKACVMLREEQDGDKRLVAYVTLKKQSDSLTLKDLLQRLNQFLPQYMLPQHLVLLDELPLTANGKVDRKQLPAPQLEELPVANKRAAKTESQAAVIVLFSKVLSTDSDRIGLDDFFFDLGGHSLLAIKLLIELNARKTGEKILLRHILLENVEQIAARLDAGSLQDSIDKYEKTWLSKVFPWRHHS